MINNNENTTKAITYPNKKNEWINLISIQQNYRYKHKKQHVNCGLVFTGF